ncbi:MAG: hypothetical protein KDD94_05570 [Calditrichaeota bacterium]|nr:hypothetical protein [Calditrichota bacterium]
MYSLKQSYRVLRKDDQILIEDITKEYPELVLKINHKHKDYESLSTMADIEILKYYEQLLKHMISDDFDQFASKLGYF